MRNRYSDGAGIVYHDTSRPEVRAEHADEVRTITEQGLVYPVTFIEGRPVHDGAVSYPAIMRAVESLLSHTAEG